MIIAIKVGMLPIIYNLKLYLKVLDVSDIPTAWIIISSWKEHYFLKLMFLYDNLYIAIFDSTPYAYFHFSSSQEFCSFLKVDFLLLLIGQVRCFFWNHHCFSINWLMYYHKILYQYTCWNQCFICGPGENFYSEKSIY